MESEFTIRGDYNTVPEPYLNKVGGILNTNIKSKKKSIEIAIENFDFSNIWRVFNGNTMYFTWHSSSKPYIFSRYDCFLMSNSLANTVCDCKMIFLVLN